MFGKKKGGWMNACTWTAKLYKCMHKTEKEQEIYLNICNLKLISVMLCCHMVIMFSAKSGSQMWLYALMHYFY